MNARSPWFDVNLLQVSCAKKENVKLLLQKKPKSMLVGTQCQNPSSPMYYLSPALCGHVLGLAISKADDAKVELVFKSNGIFTNKIRTVERKYERASSKDVVISEKKLGEDASSEIWTGVSLSRYKRLVDALRDDYNNPPEKLNSDMANAFAWTLYEKTSRSKTDLLDFVLALNEHVPDSIAQEYQALTTSEEFRLEFIQRTFTPQQLTDDALLSEQLTKALSTDDLQAWEFVAAGLANTAQSFKPGWKIIKRSYRGTNAKLVPDCVEVALREVFDLLLYDPVKGVYRPDWLPSSGEKLLAFYQAVVRDADVVKDEEGGASQAWFDLCQNMSIASVDYISTAPSSGERYELHPSLKTVFGAASELVWGSNSSNMTAEQSSPCQAFVQRWNRETGLALQAKETRDTFRAQLSDETRIREIVHLKYPQSKTSIEVTLDPQHRLATVKHHRFHGEWILKDLVLNQWQSRKSSLTNEFAYALYSAVLNDWLMLGRSIDLTGSDGEYDFEFMHALMSCRWGANRDAKSPLEGGYSVADRTDREIALERQTESEICTRAMTWAGVIARNRGFLREVDRSVWKFLALNVPEHVDSVNLALAISQGFGDSQCPASIKEIFLEYAKYPNMREAMELLQNPSSRYRVAKWWRGEK